MSFTGNTYVCKARVQHNAQLLLLCQVQTSWVIPVLFGSIPAACYAKHLHSLVCARGAVRRRSGMIWRSVQRESSP
ncbi:hypothetical protein L209DRAFT_57079 [Thermothelomyces heterothallicus CBS 203.75]